MNVCIYGFNNMFIGGKYVGQPIFLKKMVDGFNSLGHSCFYLYREDNSDIKSIDLKFDMVLLPLNLDDIEFIFNEFYKYDLDEINDIVYCDVEKFKLLHKADYGFKLKHNAIKILELIRKYDSQFNFDMFIVWGTGYIPRTIVYYAKKNNKKLVILENGCFGPFTLTVDSTGVNAENSVPRNPDFYRQISVDYVKLKQYLKKPLIAEKDVELSQRFLSGPPPIEFNSGKNSFLEDAPFGDYLFVPFQLQTDSQILRHSPYIKFMKELVIYTIASVNYYNKKYNENLGIIFKPHPSYKRDGSSFDLKEITQICKAFDNVMLVHDIDTIKLIQGCRAVVTINSAIGIEALMEGKKVITLGNAFYNILGISCHVTPDMLMTNLKEILDQEMDHELISSFLYYLRFEYFAEIFYPDADKRSINRLINKMIHINK